MRNSFGFHISGPITGRIGAERSIGNYVDFLIDRTPQQKYDAGSPVARGLSVLGEMLRVGTVPFVLAGTVPACPLQHLEVPFFGDPSLYTGILYLRVCHTKSSNFSPTGRVSSVEVVLMMCNCSHGSVNAESEQFISALPRALFSLYSPTDFV